MCCDFVSVYWKVGISHTMSYISGLGAPAEEQQEVQENMFTLSSESAV